MLKTFLVENSFRRHTHCLWEGKWLNTCRNVSKRRQRRVTWGCETYSDESKRRGNSNPEHWDTDRHQRVSPARFILRVFMCLGLSVRGNLFVQQDYDSDYLTLQQWWGFNLRVTPQRAELLIVFRAGFGLDAVSIQITRITLLFLILFFEECCKFFYIFLWFKSGSVWSKET